MRSEAELIKKCLREIEAKLAWGNSADWHNDVFTELSEIIQQETRVMLSPTTLKRVWGKVGYQSKPSITTLNTLARFAGYQNWRDFANKIPTKKSPRITRTISANLGIIMLSASLMTVVFISLYSLNSSRNTVDPADLSNIEFSSRPIAMGLPNSVVFELGLEGLKSDSMYIQQYWDPSKTISLTNGQTQATGQYYYPGYFRAKLIADGQILKQHDLYIKTDGWLGTLDYDPIPKYVEGKAVKNNGLAFGESIIQEIATNEEAITTTFHLVEEFNAVSGDDFILRTSLKNIYREKWAVCQRTALIILGTKSAIVVGFSIPGCVSELGIMMSEVYLSGKKHDLSGLGLDLSETTALRLEVKDKVMQVYAGDKELFKGQYNESIGQIAGIRYQFLGAGKVSSLKLTDTSGQITAIDEDFGAALQ